MQNKRKILVCPLNWGLGHATRMVPVIKKLQLADFNVIIASNGESLKYLKSELKELKFIDLPGYNVNYSRRSSQVIKMISLLPAMINWTIREHNLLKKIITKYNIDIVLSDNRFGLWNKGVKSIFITHQLKVKFPGILKYIEFIYSTILKIIINKYDECWVPDFSGEINLGGDLSHVKHKYKNLSYIGPLSRFKKENRSTEIKKFHIAFVLSGPEPQRSVFEEIILKQLERTKLNVVLVRGTSNPIQLEQSFPVFDLLNTSELIKIISESEMVICRSGYSSVMDLIALEKRAVLVPTPGQTEQEYLGNYLMNNKLFYSMRQNDFDLNTAYKNCFGNPSIRKIKQGARLDERIENLKK